MFSQSWNPPFGLWFFISLILALWAVFHTVQSTRSPLSKAVWCVVVLFIPFLGFVLWLLLGPRAKKG